MSNVPNHLSNVMILINVFKFKIKIVSCAQFVEARQVLNRQRWLTLN